MKDLIIKIWEELSPSFRKNILPLIIGILVIGIAFSFFTFTHSNSLQIKKILELRPFQFLLLAVSLSLTFLYLKKLSQLVKWKKSIKISVLTILVFAEVSFFYLQFYRSSPQMIIHVYQFDDPNYNQDVLKLCLSDIDDKFISFSFIIHVQQDILSGDSSESINGKDLLALLKKKHKISHQNEVAVALTSKMLHTDHTNNLFSYNTEQYSLISTNDWKYLQFQPVSVYQYIINQMIQSVLVSTTRKKNPRIAFHDPDVTVGCIFDYNYEKTAVINSIIRPTICPMHKKLIKGYFGSHLLTDTESVLGMSWWHNLQPNLREFYNY